MRSWRSCAAVVIAAAVVAVVATPASAAYGPSIGSGSCVQETSAGIATALGSAAFVEQTPSGVVDRSAACSAPWVQPLRGWVPISSPFGMRVHPITGDHRMHWGTDYAGSGIRGAELRSIADGTVVANIESYATTGAGNTIVILHAGNVRSQYMHMGARSPIPVGASVRAGQPIGVVGSTGGVTGPHLHLEVRVNGTLVDPVPFLAPAPYLR